MHPCTTHAPMPCAARLAHHPRHKFNPTNSRGIRITWYCCYLKVVYFCLILASINISYFVQTENHCNCHRDGWLHPGPLGNNLHSKWRCPSQTEKVEFWFVDSWKWKLSHQQWDNGCHWNWLENVSQWRPQECKRHGVILFLCKKEEWNMCY